MQTTRSSSKQVPIDSLIRRWVPLSVIASYLVILAVRQAAPIRDTDVWWHLSLGNQFRRGWDLSQPDPLSPFAAAPWVPTQWSLEVIGSHLVEHLGFDALPLLVSVGVAALGVAVWFSSRERANPVAALVATGLCLIGAAPVIAPRPQLASLAFLAVVATAWLRTHDDLRPRWWLVPLTWLWACTHGFWFVGVLVGLVSIVGLALDRRLDRHHLAVLAGVPLASLLVAALTPVGPLLLLAPLRVASVTGSITEWQPPDFTSASVAAVAVMAAVVIVKAARQGGTSWTTLCVLGLALAFLVYAQRTVPLAGVLLAPLFAAALQARMGPSITPVTRSEVAVTLVGAVAAVAFGFAAVMTSDVSFRPVSSTVDAALSELEPGTVVFNAYELGGWMAWAHPDLVHGVDGLTESYSPTYLSRYFAAESLLPGWEGLVDEIAAEAAFLPIGHPATAALQQQRGWTVMAQDDKWMVLVRP